MPDHFQSASRREPWLPHQWHKTLYAKYSPHLKYLPINHRHNFSSNGRCKLHRVHPDVSEFRASSLIFLRAALCEGDVSFLWAFAAVTFIFSLSPMAESISPGHDPFLCVFFWGNNNLSLHISVVTTLSSTKMITYGINERGEMFRSIPNHSSSYQPWV